MAYTISRLILALSSPETLVSSPIDACVPVYRLRKGAALAVKRYCPPAVFYPDTVGRRLGEEYLQETRIFGFSEFQVI